MIKEALEYLMSFRTVEIVNHNNAKYSNQQLSKLPELKADPVTTKSLASIVDLVSSQLDHSRIADLKIIIQVEGPTKVKVFTSLCSNLDRKELYTASAEVPALQLNNFIALEAMNIHLKSCFVPAEQRESLIALLGNVQEEAVRTSTDDGFSQTVVARTGIATKSNVPVPSIVKLTPYRTFLEVEQPESEFLCRMQASSDSPKVALFEADGGAWRLASRQNIKLFFQIELEALVDANRVVILE
ncbi:conserved hypothetical protein [Candidatus Desulfosporosinus infrequens]|uniref:Uncharacterized protein n=1 Tax=Candidatus Desulfosporosinus infrequens TaxID=2043169 RepID=A0A2U3LIH8_9FIRM|nr:conserved hypothetical protein [Candidatus Desulfosporosinus infrequens]